MTIAKKCPECDEDGWRYDSLGFRWTCPTCGGRGEILDGQGEIKCIYHESETCDNIPECNPDTHCLGCGLNPNECGE
jgi:DnaJ-class molecular chaperone